MSSKRNWNEAKYKSLFLYILPNACMIYYDEYCRSDISIDDVQLIQTHIWRKEGKSAFIILKVQEYMCF